ncbi:MAG: hypothetical protein KAX49_03825 [Halanaerobiales bacterium]|nr:hypothetical protein [Halanaerobiales bacterium]
MPICGDGLPISDPITAPSGSKNYATAKIYKSSGAVYELALVKCSVRLTNPCDNDEGYVEGIDNGALEVGDRIHIWVGYPGKYLAFVGDINRLRRDKSGITKANLESVIDILKYRYLKEDKSYSEVQRKSAVYDLLSEYASDLAYNLDIDDDPTPILTEEYWAWDKTVFEILTDILWDYNIYYVYKELKITPPDDEINLVLDYQRSKFEDWQCSEEQNNQFRLIHVDGSDTTSEKEMYLGKKEFSYNNMTLTNQKMTDRIANILGEEKNETLYNVQIKLPYLIPPRIGRVKVRLPGLNKDLIIKELNYEVSGTSLSSTLTLGSHRSPISSIMDKLIKLDDKSHFIY